MDELQERRGPGRPPNPRPAEPQPQEQPRSRPARKPFGTLEQKGTYPVRPGYKNRWFNDVPGRIERAEEGGWSLITGKDGKPMRQVCGTAEGGGPLHRFLMEIPEEWYREDMAAQQAEIDAKETIIKRGKFESKEGDGRYVPAQGISIKHGS